MANGCSRQEVNGEPPLGCRDGGADPAFSQEWRPWTTADFSPDGRLVAIAGTSQKPVPIWDVETGELVRVIEQGTKAVRFAPDGKSVFTEFFYTLTRFDVATGENMPKVRQVKEGNWMFATPREGTLVAGTLRAVN